MIHIDIFTSLPLFFTGGQKVSLPRFRTHSHSEHCDLKTEQNFKRLKQFCTAPMSVLLSVANPMQLGPPTLRSIVPVGAPKV